MIVQTHLVEQTLQQSVEEHNSIIDNINFHLTEDSFPILQIGTILYYAILLKQDETTAEINEETKKQLSKNIVSFMYRHMNNIPLNDIALSFQFLEALDQRRVLKYFSKIEEVITHTSPKMLILPTPMALIQIMSQFK